jgi:hypothetical protein
MTTTDTAAALAALRDAWIDIVAADAHACEAIENLDGARRARAEELHSKLADAYVHCRRLTVICEGDLDPPGAAITTSPGKRRALDSPRTPPSASHLTPTGWRADCFVLQPKPLCATPFIHVPVRLPTSVQTHA